MADRSDDCVGCGERRSDPDRGDKRTRWSVVHLPESPTIARHICPLCVRHMAIGIAYKHGTDLTRSKLMNQQLVYLRGDLTPQEYEYEAVRDLMKTAIELDEEIDDEEENHGEFFPSVPGDPSDRN